jgi:hypothetical protein
MPGDGLSHREGRQGYPAGDDDLRQRRVEDGLILAFRSPSHSPRCPHPSAANGRVVRMDRLRLHHPGRRERTGLCTRGAQDAQVLRQRAVHPGRVLQREGHIAISRRPSRLLARSSSVPFAWSMARAAFNHSAGCTSSLSPGPTGMDAAGGASVASHPLLDSN